jgi:hypothetical protein
MVVTEDDGILSASVNIFNGVDVDPEGLPEDPERFAELLRRSLGFWKVQGLKVVWLTLPLCRATLIPVAAESGFVFHHSDPAALIMTLRLQSGAFVPPHATHYIGAGWC